MVGEARNVSVARPIISAKEASAQTVGLGEIGRGERI